MTLRFLNNYGHFLNKHDQHNLYSEILLSKALEIRKEFYNKGIDSHDADYAQALNNYSNSLLNKGELFQSLSGFEEVLEIYQRLAIENPPRYLVEVAMVLVNMAIYNFKYSPNFEKSKEYCNKVISLMEPLLKQTSINGVDLNVNADIESFPKPLKYTLIANQIISSIEGEYM